MLLSASAKKQDKSAITIENAPSEEDKKEQVEESLKDQVDKSELVIKGPPMEKKKKTKEETTKEKPEPKE